MVDLYTENAVLVINPGNNAVGKAQIRPAMERIAADFDRSLEARQAGTVILETGDTALGRQGRKASAKNSPMVERKATYVFEDAGDRRPCAIDNPMGMTSLTWPGRRQQGRQNSP